MVLLMMTLILSGYFVPIEVMDFPYRDDPVYLAYMEGEDSWFVSFTMSPDSGAAPFAEWVEFPGMLNPPKVYAGFDEDSRTLSVYSQYPFSANYYLATYNLADDGNLSLLEAGGHDYYLDKLQRMEETIREGDYTGTVQVAGEVMYPGANPYGRQMSVLLLMAGLSMADELWSEGASAEDAMEPLGDVNSIAWNLTGEPIHRVILTPEDYPDESYLSLFEYGTLLRDYANLLQMSGDETLSAEVFAVMHGLEEE